MLQPSGRRLFPANHKILGAWHQSTLQWGGASSSTNYATRLLSQLLALGPVSSNQWPSEAGQRSLNSPLPYAFWVGFYLMLFKV